jgi:hypothetical protein
MNTNYRVVAVRRANVGLIVVGLVCLVVAMGFYLGWFKVSEHRDVSNSVNVNLRVDSDKIKHDVRSATDKTEQKASELSSNVKREADSLKSRASSDGK